MAQDDLLDPATVNVTRTARCWVCRTLLGYIKGMHADQAIEVICVDCRGPVPVTHDEETEE